MPGQAEARDEVCLWWARRHGGMGLLVFNQEMLLAQHCVVKEGDGNPGLDQAIGKPAGAYHGCPRVAGLSLRQHSARTVCCWLAHTGARLPALAAISDVAFYKKQELEF